MILVFLILIAVFHQEKFELHKNLKNTLMVLSFIAVIIAGLIFTGAWNYLSSKFTGPDGSSLITNVVFIVIIIAGFLIVWFGDKDKKKDGDKS